MPPNKNLVLKEPFFKFIVKWLKIIGLWRISYSAPVLILSLSHMFGTAIFLILLEFTYIFLDVDKDYTEVIKTIGTTLYHMLCLNRMIHFLYCVKKVPEILEKVQRNSFDFKNLYVTSAQKVNRNMEGNISQKNNKNMWNEDQTVESKILVNILNAGIVKMRYGGVIKFYRLVSFALFWVMMFGASMSLSFSYISSMLIPAAKIFDEALNETVAVYRLPYDSYHFLDLKDNKIFIFETIYQCYSISYMSACILAVDSIFYGILLHTTAQVVVLQNILGTIKIYRNQNENTLTECQIKKCLKETVEISRIRDMLQSVLQNVYMIQYILVVFIICTIIYIAPLESQPLKLIGYFVFAFLVSLETLITCILFQNLTIQFSKLADAIYFLNWDDATPNLRKKLTFAMARLQKPLVIKIFHVVTLNTDMYINVMKATYSFYTLISRSKSNVHI